MSPRAEFWVLILTLAAGTFLLRSVPLWLEGRMPTPAWLQRLLRHVPAAALAALVVPASLYVKSGAAYQLAPARVVAALAALLVALRRKSALWVLAVGMVVLWVAQWACGLLGW